MTQSFVLIFFNIKAQYTRVSLGEIFKPSNVWLLALHLEDTIGNNEGQISPNYKDNNCEILNLEEKIKDLRDSLGTP